MAAQCSVLAWEIPGTKGPGGLPVMGLQKSQIRLKDLATTKQCKIPIYGPHYFIVYPLHITQNGAITEYLNLVTRYSLVLINIKSCYSKWNN